MDQTVTMSQNEWRTVTAALLALYDKDDFRGAIEAAMEVETIRNKVRVQLGWRKTSTERRTDEVKPNG